MGLKLYSLRDGKTGSYHVPWYQKTHGEAERFINTICTEDPKTLPSFYQLVSKYPQDFDMYYLGDFDESSGKIELLTAPQRLVNVANLKSNSINPNSPLHVAAN